MQTTASLLLSGLILATASPPGRPRQFPASPPRPSPSSPSPRPSSPPCWRRSRRPAWWTRSQAPGPSQSSPPPTQPLPRCRVTPWPRCCRTRRRSPPSCCATSSPQRSGPGTSRVATAGGEEIEVGYDNPQRYLRVRSSVGETGVAAFDILATNGVVHLVNNVF